MPLASPTVLLQARLLVIVECCRPTVKERTCRIQGHFIVRWASLWASCGDPILATQAPLRPRNRHFDTKRRHQLNLSHTLIAITK